MFQGKVIIFSAPSGSGKTSIVKALLEKNQKLGFSISACTRPPRNGEQNGRDYYFLTVEDFEGKIAGNQFVEWEEVYAGSFYGTLKAEVDRLWSQEQHVVFDVDVNGGLRLKEYFGQNALAIFVDVPSTEVLRERLTKRGTETAMSLKKRLEKVALERTFKDQFDVVLVNEDLEETIGHAQTLIDEFIQTQPINSDQEGQN